MELKMYQFDGSTVFWVCATNEHQAINIFKSFLGERKDFFGDKGVREMSPNEFFTYYPVEFTPETDTINNLIQKYCTKPDIFANSNFIRPASKEITMRRGHLPVHD